MPFLRDDDNKRPDIQPIGICPLCSGKLEWKKVPYSFSGVLFGEYDAELCVKCGEAFFTEEASDLMTKKAKELGLWGALFK